MRPPCPKGADPAAPAFFFKRKGRSWRTLLALFSWWGALTLAALWVDASLWILVPLACVGLPAVADLWRAPVARLSLTDTALCWHTGVTTRSVALADIIQVRLDTRWDFSVRVRLHMADKTCLTLPPHCTPPHRAFEQALTARGIATRRNHFTFT